MSILKYEYQNKIVLFGLFEDELYINTKIANEFNKKFENYLKTKVAKKYIKTVQNITSLKDNLIIKKNNEIWIHNLLATDFTKWLSFEFSIWHNLKLKEILSKNDKYIKILENENEALHKYMKYQDIKTLFIFEMKENIIKELEKIDKVEKRSSLI